MSLLLARDYAKCSAHLLHLISQESCHVSIHQRTERLRNLPKILQLVSSESRSLWLRSIYSWQLNGMASLIHQCVVWAMYDSQWGGQGLILDIPNSNVICANQLKVNKYIKIICYSLETHQKIRQNRKINKHFIYRNYKSLTRS